MSEKNDKEKSSFRDELPTLALAIGVALLIRTFLFQSFYVPSESMYPSMLIGDHVFVNKFIYGPTATLLDGYLPRKMGIETHTAKTKHPIA